MSTLPHAYNKSFTVISISLLLICYISFDDLSISHVRTSVKYSYLTKQLTFYITTKTNHPIN
nr:MAG TPA: hypothetical protein [Caudoviricetes sp.]